MLAMHAAEEAGDLATAIRYANESSVHASFAGRVSIDMSAARLEVTRGEVEAARRRLWSLLVRSPKKKRKMLPGPLGALLDFPMTAEERTSWWRYWGACARANRVTDGEVARARESGDERAAMQTLLLYSRAPRVTAVLHMAQLLVREGRPDEARAALRDVLDASTKPRARAMVLVLGMLADLGLEDRTTWWEVWDACARARRVASRDRLVAAGDPTAAMVALKAALR
jgi:uncharacterized protein HemY